MLQVNDFPALRNYIVEQGLWYKREEIEIESLEGGVSNQVLKITSPGMQVVLKQPLKKLKVKEEWLSDINRIQTEKDCLKLFNRIIPNYVPKFVFEDDSNYLFIMEYIPDTFSNWKSELMQGNLSFLTAKSVAAALSTIHNQTHGDVETMERFGSKQNFLELRIDPFFRRIQEKHPFLKAEIEQNIERSLDSKMALVTADFSPKNIMVDRQRVVLIDFEIAHYGDPAFDLAFLSCHLVLKSIINREYAESYLNMLRVITYEYYRHITFMQRSEIEPYAVRHLAFLLLARVDGKSPAEYIRAEEDKQWIRAISYEIIKSNMKTCSEVIELVLTGAKRLENRGH